MNRTWRRLITDSALGRGTASISALAPLEKIKTPNRGLKTSLDGMLVILYRVNTSETRVNHFCHLSLLFFEPFGRPKPKRYGLQ